MQPPVHQIQPDVPVGRITAARHHRQSLNQRQANSIFRSRLCRASGTPLGSPLYRLAPAIFFLPSRTAPTPTQRFKILSLPTHGPNSGLRYHNRLPLHNLLGQSFSRTSGLHVLRLILITPLTANLVLSQCSQPYPSQRCVRIVLGHGSSSCTQTLTAFLGQDARLRQQWPAKARPACATVCSYVSHRTVLHT